MEGHTQPRRCCPAGSANTTADFCIGSTVEVQPSRMIRARMGPHRCGPWISLKRLSAKKSNWAEWHKSNSAVC